MKACKTKLCNCNVIFITVMLLCISGLNPITNNIRNENYNYCIRYLITNCKLSIISEKIDFNSYFIKELIAFGTKPCTNYSYNK